MSFLDSDFENITTAAGCDLACYNRITNSITDMAAAMASISDNAGSLSLDANKVITWAGIATISWSASKVQVDYLSIESPWEYGSLTVSGNYAVLQDFTQSASTTLTISGAITIVGKVDVETVTGSSITLEQVAEPDDPADDGTTILWCSNGTGVGDAGDIMSKTKWGTVKTGTVMNFA